MEADYNDGIKLSGKKHEELIMSRKKNCTVRLGDVRNQYPESSIVWITTGKKYEVKKDCIQQSLIKFA